MNKWNLVWIIVAAGVVAAFTTVILMDDDLEVPVRKTLEARKSPSVAEAAPERPKPKKAKPVKAKKEQKAKAPADAKKKRRRVVRAEPYSPEDQKLVDAVQSALDNEDFTKTTAAATEAMKSENADVRNEAVDALGWFGEKALVALTKAMKDKNSEVVDNARSHVENALMGIDDSMTAFRLAGMYADTFGEDTESSQMFFGVMTSSANQVIDPDDPDSLADCQKAAENRLEIAQLLTKMIDGKDGKLAKEAKEAYEQITGEEWTTVEAAEKWIQDIEIPAEDEDEHAADEDAGESE